jgi:crotonobetainyl-CoA:carnitine CoA-transferase CaiB-like acyl-CoA transferase
VPGSLFKLSKTPGKIDYHAPFLGENNQDVLSEMLGYTEKEVNKLDDEGII